MDAFQAAIDEAVQAYKNNAKGPAAFEKEGDLLTSIEEIKQTFVLNNQITQLEADRVSEQIELEAQVQKISELEERQRQARSSVQPRSNSWRRRWLR